MATDRPPRPRRRKSSILLQRVPKPAPAADAAAEPVNSQTDVCPPTTVVTDAQSAQVLAETEFAIGGGDKSRESTSGAVAAILASLDGLWVFSIPNRIVHWRIPGSWWLGVILSSTWPLMLNGFLNLIYGRIALHTAAAWLWLSIFAATQAGALLTGRILWGRLIRDMPIIVRMLPSSADDRNLAAWMRSWFSVSLQATAGFVFSGLGAIVLWLASPAVGQHLELGLMSYISVAWTSFMGGLVLYGFAMAIFIVIKIQAYEPLILDPWEPASTPGLRSLSRGYIYCLAVLTVMAAGLEIAATRVPGYRNSGVLGGFVIGFPVFAVLCGTLVGLVPNIVIGNMTYLRKMKTRADIDEAIGDITASMNEDHERLATLVWLRNQVSSTPSLPVRAPWLVPMAAALLGPLVAFLLTFKR